MKTALKILLPLVVLGITAGAVLLLLKNRQEIKPEPVKEIVQLVEVVRAEPGPHQFTVESQGEVAARTEIDLVSEVPGKVIWVAPDFADGGFFQQGDSLVKIDPRDFELAITQAEAVVAKGRVVLERELAEARVARKEWDQLGQGEANALLLREPQLADAEAALRSALANLEKAKLDHSRCNITAPFTGRIRAKRIDVGQFLNRGTPVARVYAVDYVEIALPLPLDDLAFLNLDLGTNGSGAKPAVTIRSRLAGSESIWAGHLVRTAGDINPHTRMLTGIARVDDPYGLQSKDPKTPLPVGLFVNAEIAGRNIEAVYRVPRAAMRGRDQLMVVDAEDRIRFRTVEVIRLLTKQVLLKSGLETGDRVCVSLLEAPIDGMKVNPRDLEQGETE